MVLAAFWYAFHEKMPRAEVPLGSTGVLAGIGGNRTILACTIFFPVFAVKPLATTLKGAIDLGTGDRHAPGRGLHRAVRDGYLLSLVVLAAGMALALAICSGGSGLAARLELSSHRCLNGNPSPERRLALPATTRSSTCCPRLAS